LLLITILSFGQCYFWVVFLHNVLFVIKVKVCDALLLKVIFFLVASMGFLLLLIGYNKAHLRYLVLITYKSSTNFFCLALKSHSTPYVRMVHRSEVQLWDIKNHEWCSCFSLWIELAKVFLHDIQGSHLLVLFTVWWSGSFCAILFF